MFRSTILFCAALALTFSSVSSTSNANEDHKTAGIDTAAEYRTVKVGVLAKRGVERCQEIWGPTADYLTERIPGYSFTIVPLTFDEVYPSVERGEVDFVLTNSSIYVALENYYGSSRIATLKYLYAGEEFTVSGGVIFSRANRNDIKYFDDLRGKSFMAVEEESFGGWQTSWRELKEHGIDPYRDFASLSFGGTHDAVVYAVRDGRVDAGSVRTNTLEQMSLEGKIRLEDFQVIAYDHIHKHTRDYPFFHSTETYPEWPFAKVKHTSDILAERVSVALLEMSSDDPAAIAARCVGWTIPLNYQPVHDCLKELRIGPYKDYGKITAEDVVRKYWLWIAGVIVVVSIVIMILAYVFRLALRLSEALTITQDEIVKRKQAEEATREANEHFQLAFETANLAICLMDIDARFTSVNKQMCRMYGYTKEELESMTVKDITHPEDLDVIPRFIQSALSDKIDHQRFIKRYIHKDGHVIWGEVSSTIVRDGHGNPLHFISYILDITERKQAEKALQDSEQRLKYLMSSVPVGISVSTPEGQVLEANDLAVDMLGYDSKESFLSVSATAHYYDPQDRERFVELFKGGSVHNLEVRLKRRNGSLLWCSVSSVKQESRDGMIKFFNAFKDITERKQAEEALKESEHRYHLLFEDSPISLWEEDFSEVKAYMDMLKTKGVSDFREYFEENPDELTTCAQKIQILDVNKSTLELHEAESKEELLGSIDRTFTEASFEVFKEELITLAEGGTRFESEAEVKTLSGQHIDVDIRFSVTRTETNGINHVRALLAISDITERKQAEETRAALQSQLVQSEKLASIGQLAAGIAHEINNPIGFISSNLDTMKKYLTKIRHFLESNGGHDSDEQREITEIVTDFGDAVAESIEGADRVKKIVADLKGFVRVDTGEMELADINAGLESTLSIVWNQLKYTCTIEKDLGRLPGVYCHPNRMNQVFMNLLLNAGQAIGDGSGTIRIRSWADDEQVYVAIKDDGCGISEEHIDKIFDPFFTTKDVGKGTGLGLSLSHDIIKDHGGRIDVNSVVGQGTEFIVSLPIEPSLTAVEPAEADVVEG